MLILSVHTICGIILGVLQAVAHFYVFSSLVKSSSFISMVPSTERSGFLLIVLSTHGKVEGFHSETKNGGKEKGCQSCDPLLPSFNLCCYPHKCMSRAMKLF